MTSTALPSLYGGKVAKKRALAGNVGVAPEKREQTVLTPRWFVDQLGPISLDPCTTAENPLDAQVFCTSEDEVHGLVAPWRRVPGLFFANPPYDELEAWLAKARAEWLLGARGYLLGPTRPHREWFGSLVEGLEVANLRPLRFVGHKSGFPAPLCLVCYGVPVPRLLDLVSRKPRSMIVSVSRYDVRAA